MSEGDYDSFGRHQGLSPERLPEELPGLVENGLEVLMLCWEGKARSRDMQEFVRKSEGLGDAKQAHVDGGVKAMAKMSDREFEEVVEAISQVPIVASITTDEELVGYDDFYEKYGENSGYRRSERQVIEAIAGAVEKSGNVMLKSKPDRESVTVGKIAEAIWEIRGSRD